MQAERPGCTQVHQTTVFLCFPFSVVPQFQWWLCHSISKEPTAACKQCVCAFKEENGHQRYRMVVHHYSDSLKKYSFSYLRANQPLQHCNSHLSSGGDSQKADKTGHFPLY